ncbi:MAG TPA: methyltransferase domain-containing protein [Bryobacteraceae bacterium]|nr:methyltransferase domain-containing protein [Bryobacteraceae bacterium]
MVLRRPSPLKACLSVYALVFLAIVIHFYPSRTDPPEAIHFQPTPEAQDFYNVAFDAQQARYEVVARDQAELLHIRDKVEEFVEKNHLSKAHVLDVGSGEGRLQDVVDDYTGLDISATARAKYHKRFVQADARAMPFRDGEFDAVWTIWVLEHVPNPEQALREIRRVLKPGGLLFLYPAWLCSDLNAQGYPVRPYSDFGAAGKLIKFTVPLQRTAAFKAMYMLPIRAARLAAWKLHQQPTTLHYRPLEPNYKTYWMPDSDAVNSIDMFEMYLWFRSRGDECLNCPSESELMTIADIPLVFRVKTQTPPPTQTARRGQ